MGRGGFFTFFLSLFFLHSCLDVSLTKAWAQSVKRSRSVSEAEVTIRSCASVVGARRPKTYRFSRLGPIENLSGMSPEVVEPRVLEVIASNVIKKKRLPTDEEMAKVSDRSLFGSDGLFKDRSELIEKIRDAHPALFAALEAGIQKQAFLFFRHRLRPPTFLELQDILKFDDIELLKAILSQPGFWNRAVISDNGQHLEGARRRLRTAYAAAVRGTHTPSERRTRKVEPTRRQVIETLIRQRTNLQYAWRAVTGDYGHFDLFDRRGEISPSQMEQMMDGLVEEFEVMLGERKIVQKTDKANQNEQWAFEIPILFPGGFSELGQLSQLEYQPTFKSFENTKFFNEAYAQSVRDAIVAAPGILVSSVKPGRKVEWPLIDMMLRMSKDRGYPVILIPEDNSTKELDEKLWDLVRSRKVLILTEDIGNKEFLLSAFPANGRKDPLRSFEKPGMARIGQQIILPSHIMSHRSIATLRNAINQTQLYSTGTVSSAKMIGSVGRHQKVKAREWASEAKLGFLVAQKVDKGEQEEFNGVRNHWHIRPVEYKPAEGRSPAVVVDDNVAYLASPVGRGEQSIRTESADSVEIVLPDVHFIVANPGVMKAIKELIGRYTSAGVKVTLIMHDVFESRAINGHVEVKQENFSALNTLYQKGSASLEDEYNEGISNFNILLSEFPQVEFVVAYSNHTDEWIERNLINKATAYQRIVNGPLKSEIEIATKANGWSPMEYLLLHREKFLQATSLSGSDRWKDNRIFLSDPSRVRVLSLGEMVSSAPDNDWQPFYQQHGHKGPNGAPKSSMRVHALAEERMISGHTHSPKFEFRGERSVVMEVGMTAIEQPYMYGAPSSWGVALAVISRFKTVTLLHLDLNSQSFYQRSELGYVQGEDFFGDDPLKVRSDFNIDDDRRQTDSVNFYDFFMKLSRFLRDDLVVSAPQEGYESPSQDGSEPSSDLDEAGEDEEE